MYSDSIWNALGSLYDCMCMMAGEFPRLMASKKVNAVFIWGRAAGEWELNCLPNTSVLQKASDIFTVSGAQAIVVPGYRGSERGQGETGFVGPEEWRRVLTKRYSVPSDRILSTMGQGINTKTETEDLLDLMGQRNWSIAVGVTLQTHALRAMLGMLASLRNRRCGDIVIVPVWPLVSDLTEQVYGSQGDGPLPRYEWIKREFDRIVRYTAQGDMASFEELKEYLSDALRIS